MNQPEANKNDANIVLYDIAGDELGRIDQKYRKAKEDLAQADKKAKALLETDKAIQFSDNQNTGEIPVQQPQKEKAQVEQNVSESAPDVATVKPPTITQSSDKQTTSKKALSQNLQTPNLDNLDEKLKKLTAHLEPPPSVEASRASPQTTPVFSVVKEEKTKPIIQQDTFKKEETSTTKIPKKLGEDAGQQIFKDVGIVGAISDDEINTKTSVQLPKENDNLNKSSEKYTLSPMPEPEWAKKLIQQIEAENSNTVSEQTVKPSQTVESASSETNKTTNLTNNQYINNTNTASNVINNLLRSSINKGFQAVAGKGKDDVLESVLNSLPFVNPTVPPDNLEPTQNLNNMSQSTPNIQSKKSNFEQPERPRNISVFDKKQQSNMSGATEKSLINMNKNIDKLASTVQQNNQILIRSLQALNATASEILRIIPMQSGSQGMAGAKPGSKKSTSFTPSESINLIGAYRKGLGLTPTNYVNNTIFPG